LQLDALEQTAVLGGELGLGQVDEDLAQLTGQPRLSIGRRFVYPLGQRERKSTENPLGAVQAQIGEEVGDGNRDCAVGFSATDGEMVTSGVPRLRFSHRHSPQASGRKRTRRLEVPHQMMIRSRPAVPTHATVPKLFGPSGST
jgi:hypothetical protein